MSLSLCVCVSLSHKSVTLFESCALSASQITFALIFSIFFAFFKCFFCVGSLLWQKRILPPLIQLLGSLNLDLLKHKHNQFPVVSIMFSSVSLHRLPGTETTFVTNVNVAAVQS